MTLSSDFNMVLSVVKNIDIFQTIPLYLLATLGLRSCEVCGLKWEDIDFNNKIVSIKRDRVYTGKQFGIVISSTKTNGSTRDLYMCSML